MQEISRFSGFVIFVNAKENDDPRKARVEVYYGDYFAIMSVDGYIIQGSLPFEQMTIMAGWLKFYQEDIYRNWEIDIKRKYVDKVPQLKRSRVTVKNDIFDDTLTLVSCKPLKWGIMLVTYSNEQMRLFDTVSLEESKYISLREPDVFNYPKVENGQLTFKNGELEITPETVYKFSFKYKG